MSTQTEEHDGNQQSNISVCVADDLVTSKETAADQINAELFVSGKNTSKSSETNKIETVFIANKFTKGIQHILLHSLYFLGSFLPNKCCRKQESQYRTFKI